MVQVGTLINPQQLEQAFQAFKLASPDLRPAYEELRQQVLDEISEIPLPLRAPE